MKAPQIRNVASHYPVIYTGIVRGSELLCRMAESQVECVRYFNRRDEVAVVIFRTGGCKNDALQLVN